MQVNSIKDKELFPIPVMGRFIMIGCVLQHGSGSDGGSGDAVAMAMPMVLSVAMLTWR